MASIGRSRSRRRGEGDGSSERNAAHSTVPAVDHLGAGSLRKQASDPGILSDSLFAVERRRIKPKKASSVPMKMLIDEEFSKDVNARYTSPGVVGRLMGLDSLPSFGAHSQHIYTQSHAQKNSPGNSHDRYGFSEDIPHRRSTDEMPEVKDVFEVREATRMKIHRSPRSGNGNVISRFDKTENADLDFVRQKFMDAKRLSTNESLQMSEELSETLDALVSNRDLLVEFLQKIDPVAKDLHDHASPSFTANCITILKPSRRNQFIDTDNIYSQDKCIYSQDKCTESYFHKQKEVKHSLRKPYAKLSSQSLKEDSGSLRHKLSRSSHQETTDKRVCPTRIVVLKPSLEKAQDIEGAFALTNEIPHSDYRRLKACQGAGIWSPYTEEPMCQVPLGDSETLGHIAKGSREIAREIMKQMIAARVGGSRKQVLKPETSTFVSDERSQFLSTLTNLKIPEALHRSSELCDGWASSSFNSSPTYSTENSVSKEAKKYLSNRWKMTRQYQHQAAENNGFGMLGDMLARSDREASKVATQTMSCRKCQKGELHRGRIRGSCNYPLGINSNDGWRDVATNNVTRSKSLPPSFNRGVQKSNNRKRTGRHNEFSMLKDVLKVGPHDSEYTCRSRQRKSLIRGSTFHGDEADLVPPDNEERMIIEGEILVNSEEPTNGVAVPDFSEQTVIHPAHPDHELDDVCYLDTSAVPEQKKESRSPARQNQKMHQQTTTALDDRLLVPSLDNFVIQAEGIERHQDDDYPTLCNPRAGSEYPVGIDHHQGDENEALWIPTTGSESPVSSNKDDHQSPVSVLESSLDAEDVYSGDFDKISTDLQELRMQLRLLKMETTDNADDMELFVLSDDEIATARQPLPEMEISHAYRDEEERDFSYVLDMLIILDINAANQDELINMRYLSDCPAGPDVYDILERKYNSLILWSSSERKLLFDLTNAVIADIVTSLMQRGSKGLLWRFSSRWDQEGFLEEVWQRVVQLRQEMEYTQEGLLMDLGWFCSEDGIDLVGRKIGRMLHEDLLEETIAELLGVPESAKLCG